MIQLDKDNKKKGAGGANMRTLLERSLAMKFGSRIGNHNYFFIFSTFLVLFQNYSTILNATETPSNTKISNNFDCFVP